MKPPAVASVALSFSLFTLGACVAPTPADDGSPSDEPTEIVETGDGDDIAAGDGASVFAADQPCGPATVATVATGADSQVMFCVRDGIAMLGEVRPLGTPSPLRVRGLSLGDRCLRDIFRALAPDREIPSVLADACATRAIDATARARTSEPVTAPILADEVMAASSYCGAGGAYAFIAELCDLGCTYGDGECVKWCIAEPWQAHQRTMSIQLGDEGDIGHERVASCNGTTRFRAWTALDAGDPWAASLDYTVPAGWVATWSIVDDHAFEDIDMRFRGDSASGAYHRHAGYFRDR